MDPCSVRIPSEETLVDGEEAENQINPEEDDAAPVAGPYVPPGMGPRRDPRARLVVGFKSQTLSNIPPSKPSKSLRESERSARVGEKSKKT